jgi:23S rRNA (adenine1618-N6)-methyltransferase
MHPRNPHQDRYDFPELLKASPELKDHVLKNKYGDASIDFDRPESVRALNRALLNFFYQIKHWDIPPQFLCPPIPGRADYIHTLKDLFPGTQKLRGLDIGVGANCIYPLLGLKTFGWSFVGSDIEKEALDSASKIIEANHLEKDIELRWQSSPDKIFQGIVKDGESFDFSLCNPPFHASAEQARAGTERKRKNLGLASRDKLNFGGKSRELWTQGGEREFVLKMIQESAQIPSRVRWFTTLISKEENLSALERKLRELRCPQVQVLNMAQGQKKSRLLAWSFSSK